MSEQARAEAMRNALHALCQLEALTAEPALAGVMEVADMRGCSKVAVLRDHARGRLPDPVATLRCGRIWLRAQVAP